MAESSFEWKGAPLSHEAPLDQVISYYKSIINSALQDALDGDAHLSIAAQRAVSAGGKRIRPIVSLLTCEAICGSYSRAIPVALSFELAHSASLIQDDIIDESSLRHHKAAIHKRYGSVRAILVSDFLLFSIFSELSKLRKMKISKNRLAQVLLQIANSAKMAAKGEFSDMLLTTKGNVTEEEYFEMAGLKTGALFAASSASGAIVAGAAKRTVEEMYHYGYFLGLSFQIADDILDFVGDPRETGKPRFKDLQNHACNIVTVHALSKVSEFDRTATDSLLLRNSYSPSDAKRIISVLESLGSLEYANELAGKYCELSRHKLQCLEDSPAKNRLEDLTHSITTPIQLDKSAKGN